MPPCPDQSRTDGMVVPRDDIPVRFVRVEALPFIFILRTSTSTRRKHLLPCFKSTIDVTPAAAAPAVVSGPSSSRGWNLGRMMSHLVVSIIILTMNIIPLNTQATDVLLQIFRRSP